MQILNSVSALKKWRSQRVGSLGMVPTMGYLHDGHASLIERSAAENNDTLVSIFVNPSQFNEQSDFDNYPRNTEQDSAICKDKGATAIFMPTPEMMYPPCFDSWVTVEKLTQRLEGKHRPGHFRGVATVVYLLFQLAKPQRAYFGQKDAQQLLVVKKMCSDLHLGVDVVGMPTIRETDGLAMSSRNARLNSNERQIAPLLYQALSTGERMIRSGSSNAEYIRTAMAEIINSAGKFTIDYISIADTGSLDEMTTVTLPCLISLAAFLGEVRLIDNVIVE